MQKPSERHKSTSDNNKIKFKKPVHDPFNIQQSGGTGLHDCYCFNLIALLHEVV